MAEFAPFIVVLVIVAVVTAVANLFRRGVTLTGPVLILRSFLRSNKPNPKGVYFQIVGRPAGIFGWLLTVLKIDSTTTLTVDRREMRMVTASLSGRLRQTIPLHTIASTHCGYANQLILLVLSLGMVPISLGGLVVAMREGEFGGYLLVLLIVIVNAALFVAFALSKTILIAVETYGGMTLGLRVKQGLIEGVKVDFDEATRVIATLNTLISMRLSSLDDPGLAAPGSHSLPEAEEPIRATIPTARPIGPNPSR